MFKTWLWKCSTLSFVTFKVDYPIQFVSEK